MKSVTSEVSKWLAEQGVDVPPSQIKTMTTVYERVTAAGLEAIMEKLDNSVGQDHPLSMVSALDKIMAMTKINGNATLSNSLLTWIFYDSYFCLESGWLDKDVKRDEIIAFCKASLLGRRIVFYLISKLKTTDTDLKGEMPKSRAGFLWHFLSFENFLKGDFHDGADQTWLAELWPFQRESLYTFKMIFSGNASVRDSLLKTTAKDPNISAEQALQLECFSKDINLQHLLDVKECLCSSSNAIGDVSVLVIPMGLRSDLHPKTATELADALVSELPQVGRGEPLFETCPKLQYVIGCGGSWSGFSTTS